MAHAASILAIDQGTTSSRAIVFGRGHQVMATSQREIPQIYPADGWVEHDPEAIWSTTLEVARNALETAEAEGTRIAAIGLTNQRETTVVWDRASGKPIYNAIVWQDRRTAGRCAELVEAGLEEEVRSRSGLVLDSYFSATKIAWILDHVPGARRRAEAGRLAFGTIDCFLLWRFTGGRVHATDASNASRTNLFNIHKQDWDDELLRIFRIPRAVLPEVLDSAAEFGAASPEWFGRPIDIRGIAGDQQAAAIGQCCFTPGAIKSTYGTGCFILVNTGSIAIQSRHRMLTTVAYRLDGFATYALEGSIFNAGSAIQWLRDGLGVVKSSQETEALAASLPDNCGVYLVPAFTGLGAPYWNSSARGILKGLTRATGPAQLARAALEATCYQTRDLLAAMTEDGVHVAALRIDGGMVANNWFVQFLADILDLSIDRPEIMETSALGAAYLAGRQAGVYGDLDEFSRDWQCNLRFTPQMTKARRSALLAGWSEAVSLVAAP
jgi:glycerol kinase